MSTLGKVYEGVINAQLMEHYSAYKPLHRAQHSFWRGIGTEQALHYTLEKISASRTTKKYTAAVSLDIKGAFDHTEWPIILQNLEEASVPHYLLRMLQQYFAQRTVGANNKKVTLERGCPQGSVLGPSLWNIMYDEVIHQIELTYPQACVYADNTLIILGSNSLQEFETIISNCITNIQTILEDYRLQLNVAKMEILVLRNMTRKERLTSRAPTFCSTNVTLQGCDQIKYLGIILDQDLKFYPHIKYIEEKCMKRQPKLKPLMQNMYGYKFKARKIFLYSCILQLFMYGSSIFYHMLKRNRALNSIEKVERRCNIIIAQEYQDINHGVSCLLAGTPPFHL